ncbi:MAG: hypothetical protein HOC74_26550 [Gemmatimonadetes bacterium]|jgi:hypothetical protein|nr:hypothetical protein [Gemmatimonadota bacterium]
MIAHYVMNRDGSDLRRLTDHPEWDGRPVWSPDGRQIAFLHDFDDLYIMDADGSNKTHIAPPEGLSLIRPYQWITAFPIGTVIQSSTWGMIKKFEKE